MFDRTAVTELSFTSSYCRLFAIFSNNILFRETYNILTIARSQYLQ
jgi:hypothetical protein